jgi:hypothetical protein
MARSSYRAPFSTPVALVIIKVIFESVSNLARAWILLKADLGIEKVRRLQEEHKAV